MTPLFHTLTVVAVLGITATPALAQVDVRVKVDTKAIREVAEEVREAVRAALGPDFQRDLNHAVRDIAGAFEGLGHVAWNAGDWSQSQRYRATQTDRDTRRFNIGASGQLDLETLSGEVTIKRGAGRELVVDIVREARGATDAAAKTGLAQVRVQSEERGGRVTIRTVYPSDRRHSDYSVSVSYIVTAPSGTRISTRSVSGNVSVEGIEGELSVNTMSGDVNVTGAARLTTAKTVSGDLTLTNVGAEGLLEASTMSGEIIASGIKARRLDLSAVTGGVTAKGVDAGDVKLHSMAGDLVFDGVLAQRGRYEFSSHSGDVRIGVDGQVGFSLEASTFSGSVHSDLTLQGVRTGTRGIGARRNATPRNLSGTFGDGSAVISATSFSGSVTLAKR